MPRVIAGHIAVTRGLLAAVFLGVAAPTPGQDADPLAAARAAEARLAFDDAYGFLSTAIETDPGAPEPYLARARIHAKLNRPGLALTDLARARAAGLADPEADLLAGRIWLANGAVAEAIAAFEAALAVRPDDPQALAARAAANTRAGLLGNALTDYDRAVALAPGDAALAEARAALLERFEESAIARITYDAEALPAPAFRLETGDVAAPHHLVIVEAGDDLLAAEDGPDGATLARATDAGWLRVTRVFTYSGADSSVWANLALICGGTGGLDALRAALTGEAGRAALTALGTSGDRSALRDLVAAAYEAAGVPGERLEDCAFDRGQALGYLADWTEKREAFAWRGVNFYESWPVFVLDETPLALAALDAELAALAPAADDASAASFVASPAAQDAPGAAETPAQNEGTDTIAARAPEDPTAQETAPPEPATASDGPAPAGEPAARPLVLPPSPSVTTEGRVPAVLRGVYGPSLVACIAFTDRIEAAVTLDALLPDLNPLDGPPIGTVLLTSRRMQLFNATDTECGLSALGPEEEETPWRAEMACANALAPDLATPLSLTRLEDDGPAPRLIARLGEGPEVELVQCRPLGRISRDAEPLWTLDTKACRAGGAVTGASFVLDAAGAEGLVLELRPEPAPAAGAAPTPLVALDGLPWDTGPVRQDAGTWRIPLGDFALAAPRLSAGLFLDVIAAGPVPVTRIPLLGSGATMDGLADCAPQTGANAEP